MAEIPPASPISPSAPVAPTAPTANNIIVETAVNNTPDKITQLARQIEVSGTLTQPPSGNSITLNTMIGPLVLLLPHLAQAQQDKLIQQLNILFQNQKSLAVVLQPGNPPAQAFLLLPPSTGGSSQNTVNTALATPLRTVAQSIQINNLLTAIVLPKSSPGTSPAPASPIAPSIPGTIAEPEAFDAVSLLQTLSKAIADEAIAKIDARTNQLSPPIQPPGAPNLSPQASPTAPLTPFPGGAIPVPNPQTPDISSLLQPGAEIKIRISAIYPPNSPAQIPPLQPNQIVATVTGNGPGGQLILNAGNSTLFVREPAEMPPGTQLLITVTPPQSPDQSVVIPLSDPLEFSTLPEIFAALTQLSPELARSIMENRVPQPGNALAGAMLFFLSAVRQGDVRSWLGNGASDILARAGKAGLLGRLLQDVQSSVQTVRDPVVGEWKSYPVPINVNGQFNIMHVYVHNERSHSNNQQPEDEQKKKSSQIRFLIDVRMSQLGPMQLDGFFKGKQLDLIIRSENPLPSELNQELRQTYASTMSTIGYDGGLSFQFGRQGWLNLQKPSMAGKAVLT